MRPMSVLPRIVSVLLGIVLTTPAVAPRIALAAPADAGAEADDATRLNAEAQQKFSDGQFADAARTYARILEVLPENRVNREERDNTLLIALEVYREAFKKQRVEGDAESTRKAAQLLCAADKHYKRYLDTYREVYGGGADPSKAALESHASLTALLKQVEGELGAPPCGPPPAKAEPKPEDPAPPDLGGGPEPPRGPSGVGLIVGGAITLTAGLGATSMIIIGGINRRKAKEIRDDEESTDGERQNARENIKRADGLIIAGSVVTGVLIAGGATMLGIGIRRRMRYVAFAPQLERGYVGLSLQGRF